MKLSIKERFFVALVLLATVGMMTAIAFSQTRPATQAVPTTQPTTTTPSTLPATRPVPVVDLARLINSAPAFGVVNVVGDGSIQYTLGGAVMGRPGVRVLGDPRQHALVHVTSTGINVWADGCEIGYLDFTGVALAVRDNSTNLYMHDCLAVMPCENLAWLNPGSLHTRLMRLGGMTRGATIYVGGGTDDTLIVDFQGRGSTDEHPLRVSGGKNVTILGGDFYSIGGKECFAPRNGEGIIAKGATFHGPALWGEGRDDGVTQNIKGSAMIGCTLCWNGEGIGGQAEVRVGADVAVLSNTFVLTNVHQQPLQVGPRSVVLRHGNTVQTLAGTLDKPWCVVSPNGQVIGADDTAVGKLLTTN